MKMKVWMYVYHGGGVVGWGMGGSVGRGMDNKDHSNIILLYFESFGFGELSYTL